MRDGIPRTLPVPRKWQVFVECADRPADRGTERSEQRFCEAIRSDLQREFPADDRQAVQRLVSQTQPSFPGFDFAGVPIEDTILARGQNHNVTEVLAAARTAVSAGASADDAIADAFLGRAEANVAERRRQISEDLAGKISLPELKRFLGEFDRVAASVDFRSEVSRFLEQNLTRESSAAEKIKADEDLRGSP